MFFVLSLLLALGFYGQPVDCGPLVLTVDNAALVTQLSADGWTADAADGLEALYAPGC